MTDHEAGSLAWQEIKRLGIEVADITIRTGRIADAMRIFPHEEGRKAALSLYMALQALGAASLSLGAVGVMLGLNPEHLDQLKVVIDEQNQQVRELMAQCQAVKL